MGAWYITRERYMRAADVKAVAYVTAEIDAVIESGARDVDRLVRRGDATRPGLAPWLGTRTFDWPTADQFRNYKFWLGPHKLIRADSVISGGTDITHDVQLSPVQSGPPYNAITVDRATNSVLTFESGVGQRSLVVTGLWGETDEERTATTWTLGSSPSATTTTVTINAPIGVGSVVRAGDERMTVTERTWATSGQTGSLSANVSAQSLTVSDGSAFFPGETLLIESERVIVQDVAGNVLTVKRAVDGTTLAAHTTATIYYARSCTVERGSLGTVADSHTSGAQVYVWAPPPLAADLNLAYALDRREQERSAYARTIGTEDNARPVGRGGIKSLEERVEERYGRPVRLGVV